MADPMSPREQEAVATRNMRSAWTPYQLAVLLHHYSSPGVPFSRADAPAYPECCRQLRTAGLMATGSTDLTLHGGRFIIALCNTRIDAPQESPKPVAWMRRWAADGVDVMKLKKADRPRGWAMQAVTTEKLFDDDEPLSRMPAA